MTDEIERMQKGEVTEAVEEIRKLVEAGDLEAAHVKEDELFFNVLNQVARAGTCDLRVRTLAREALKSKLIEFARWSA